VAQPRAGIIGFLAARAPRKELDLRAQTERYRVHRGQVEAFSGCGSRTCDGVWMVVQTSRMIWASLQRGVVVAHSQRIGARPRSAAPPDTGV